MPINKFLRILIVSLITFTACRDVVQIPCDRIKNSAYVIVKVNDKREHNEEVCLKLVSVQNYFGYDPFYPNSDCDTVQQYLDGKLSFEASDLPILGRFEETLSVKADLRLDSIVDKNFEDFKREYVNSKNIIDMENLRIDNNNFGFFVKILLRKGYYIIHSDIEPMYVLYKIE